MNVRGTFDTSLGYVNMDGIRWLYTTLPSDIG
jgi:hypothetical protein